MITVTESNGHYIIDFNGDIKSITEASLNIIDVILNKCIEAKQFEFALLVIGALESIETDMQKKIKALKDNGKESKECEK